MRQYFGYIRVSTARQGERGVSLQEQRDAIVRYAQTNNLQIREWFEERVTAAKCGRPLFMRMLRDLRHGRADGIIIHKIDRSARNLRDWANLGELLDSGVDVRFVNEALDMNTRGGRLSADIQAVVAADYIRNLREETRKGFYGRLKQGLYPLAAPIGYCDNGKAKLKTPCPVNAPIVARAFELYASGEFPLTALSDELHAMGLRSRTGGKVPRSMVALMLTNPFYTGLIRVRKTGEIFSGGHEPIVRQSLFNRVQDILQGRTPKRQRVHNLLFRQLFTCANCHNFLIGEVQKGHVYYRCQTRNCHTSSLREERLDEAVRAALAPLVFTAEELVVLEAEAASLHESGEAAAEQLLASLRVQQAAVAARLDRLTDAYLDRVLDRNAYQERRVALLQQQQSLAEKLRVVGSDSSGETNALMNFLELAKSLMQTYNLGSADEKRDLVRNVFSNRSVLGKYVAVDLFSPYQAMANRPDGLQCAQSRTTTRTFLTRLLEVLVREPDILKQFRRGGMGKQEG